MSKPCYRNVIDQLGLLDHLAKFDPVVIGTPPLGIATENSDIDIACSSLDLNAFVAVATKRFGQFNGFEILNIENLNEPAIVVKFNALDWEIELFCQNLSTAKQWGVRHFYIEQRLLALDPELVGKVTLLKQNGMKTEPTFAQLLALQGDPYEAMLDLETYSDIELINLISKR
ncbi:MAG: DUF4269 domain-containing protein [Lentilitoribacter sp.]